MPDHPTTPHEIARQAQEKILHRRRTPQGRPRRRQLALAGGSVTQRQGHAAEQRAIEYLHQQGLQILAANLRCRWGEIDLVALDGHVLVFIEVRERRTQSHGGAAASVNRRKQWRLIRTAQTLLPGLLRRLDTDPRGMGPVPPCRFDVLAYENGRPHWIRHAFEA
ncbi:YraN family protein [Castellaniella sp.]|uniref:YraN family protein n=1 Tax=Castellaniella sp. TaxID=1955812 RepID=UPI00356A8ADF